MMVLSLPNRRPRLLPNSDDRMVRESWAQPRYHLERVVDPTERLEQINEAFAPRRIDVTLTGDLLLGWECLDLIDLAVGALQEIDMARRESTLESTADFGIPKLG